MKALIKPPVGITSATVSVPGTTSKLSNGYVIQASQRTINLDSTKVRASQIANNKYNVCHRKKQGTCFLWAGICKKQYT